MVNISEALDGLTNNEKGPKVELHTQKDIANIMSWLPDIDPRLSGNPGDEVHYRGSGSMIPVDVLFELKRKIASLGVTSALSVSGEVSVGKTGWTKEQVVADITKALAK